MMKCVPQTGRSSLYEIVGVNFHLGEINIQSTEALLFYIQIGSSVHLHSIKACYSSVFIRSAISSRTENVCDIRQLDSICLFSVEMEFQRLHPICCHTLSQHEKCKVWPKCWKNCISFEHHNYFPTYTKVAFFLFWHAGCIVALYHNFLLNKRSLAKIISVQVGWDFFVRV